MIPMWPSNGFGTVKIVSMGRGSGSAEREAAEPIEPLARRRGQGGPLVAPHPAIPRVLEPEFAAFDRESLEESREPFGSVDAMPRREDGVAADRDREEHETPGR